MRVVVWDNTNPSFQGLQDGEEVTLLNVRSKPGRHPAGVGPYDEEALELHGDETTCVLEYLEETLHWIKKNAEGLFDVSDVTSSGSQAMILKRSTQDKTTDPDPICCESVLRWSEISRWLLGPFVTDRLTEKETISYCNEG